MANVPLRPLRYADGTYVSPRKAYEAFMNSRVLIARNGVIYEATGMEWHDNNSTQGDPTKVTYVGLRYVDGTSGAATLQTIQIGSP